VNDPKADVMQYDWASDEYFTGAGTPDISRLQIRHGDTRVAVRLSFHNLGQEAVNDTHYWVYLYTDADAAAEYRFEYGPSDIEMEGVYGGDSGTQKKCNMKSTIDTRDDFVLFSAPRSCLGNPKQVGARAEVVAKTGPDCCHDTAVETTRFTAKARRG
jgi:hypothetical protein